MAEIKRITPKSSQRFTFWDGLYLGLGFWTAAFVFSFVIIPALACAAFLVLSILGISLGSMVPPR